MDFILMQIIFLWLWINICQNVTINPQGSMHKVMRTPCFLKSNWNFGLMCHQYMMTPNFSGFCSLIPRKKFIPMDVACVWQWNEWWRTSTEVWLISRKPASEVGIQTVQEGIIDPVKGKLLLDAHISLNSQIVTMLINMFMKFHLLRQ